jgi:hypothetical protein
VTNKDTGETILVIPVNFTGANATPGLVNEIIERAAQLDTGGSGVKFNSLFDFALNPYLTWGALFVRHFYGNAEDQCLDVAGAVVIFATVEERELNPEL